MNAVTTRLKRISKTDDSTVIPPSHKWTEVGVLPKDWSVRSLRSCLLSVPSYGINEAAVPFDDDLPTYLRITDISKDGQFRPSPRVSVKHPNGQAFFLNEGDLVLARTGASVGKSYLYNPKDGPLVFAGFLIRISPNPEKLQPTFLAYCLQSKYYWNWVATMSIPKRSTRHQWKRIRRTPTSTALTHRTTRHRRGIIRCGWVARLI